MRLNDILIGFLFTCLGLAALGYGLTLVPPRNLPYGPGFFPQIIGGGMALAGALLMIRSIPKRRESAIASFPQWVKSGRGIGRFASIPLAIIFFVIALTPLGFPAVSWIILSSLFCVGGIRPLRAVAVAFVIAVVLTLMFASVLHVPLPWGPLTPISGYFL